MASRQGKARVLIAARELGVRDQLRQLVLANGRYEIVGAAADGQEAVQLAVLLRPDIALVKIDLPIFSGPEASEMIGLAVPETCRVFVGNGQPDAKVLRKAMRSGARAYLSSPVVASELMETLDNLTRIGNRRSTAEYRVATDPTRLPKLVVVTGGKGGIGKSTIAASLAMCLVEQHPEKVALLDMYTQFGDISTMLNVSPTKSLSDLVLAKDEIDLEALESCMCEHETGVKVLVSSTSVQPIDSISVETAESVVHALKRKYTYIVVDLPPILHATTLYMLSHCYKMILVTTMFDMLGIRDGKELYNLVVGTYVPEDKVAVVANRVSKYDRLTPDDLERTFGRALAAHVPNDRRLVSAMNQGVPFVKAYSRSPLAAAVQRIARELIEEPAADRKVGRGAA